MTQPLSNPGSFDSKVRIFSIPFLVLCRTCPSALEIYKLSSSNSSPLQPTVIELNLLPPSPSLRPDPCIVLGPSCPLLFGTTIALKSFAHCGLGEWVCSQRPWDSAALVIPVVPDLNSSAPNYNRQNCWCCPKIWADGGGDERSLCQLSSLMAPMSSFWMFVPQKETQSLTLGAGPFPEAIGRIGYSNKESIS